MEQSSGEYLEWFLGDEMGRVLNELSESKPRPAAILAGAIIEAQLERLVQHSVIDDRSPKVGTLPYSQLCSWAYRLGLIDSDLLDELKTLGNIRNAFAHDGSPDINFEIPTISALVKKLKSPQLLTGHYTADQNKDIVAMRLKLQESNENWWNAAFAIVVLDLRARSRKAKKPKSIKP